MIIKEKMLLLLEKFLKPSNKRGVVCVQISKEGLCVSWVKVKPALQIVDSQYFSGDFTIQQMGLSSFVTRNQLRYADCYVVLSLEDYQLMLIEKPKVVDNEIRESARWLVRDRIGFPIEEAVIDFFPVPMQTGQPAKIYVVVTPLQWLDKVAGIVIGSGLNLKSVNIEALAVRNILSSLCAARDSSVFLMKSKNHYHVLIIKEQLICLERKLEFGSEGESNTQLVTELQRSIDFYQNRNKTIPIKIFLDPVLGQNQKLVHFIETALNMRVEVLDIRKWFSGSIDQINCLGIVGEILGLEHEPK